MNSIVQLWRTSRPLIEDKKLQQIIGFIGEGKLRDGNDTSTEFREYLNSIPNERLIQHADECLQDSFTDSGMALQDIVNEIGVRLGFTVEHGRYRGTTGDIGFDGLWRSSDDYHIVVEVKTTDAYRINLDVVNEYRKKLSQTGKIEIERSAVLIVVGRKDTGDLEAQIRGSKHAWDIRLVSTDSLISLLALREKLSDPRTVNQISEVLKPNEYTRIDKLIGLLFTTAADVELDEEPYDDDNASQLLSTTPTTSSEQKSKPVSFHQECASLIETHLSTDLIKQSKTAYRSPDHSIGVTLAVSKTHASGSSVGYWFAFHPHQEEFLQDFAHAYVAFGCGSEELIFLFPLTEFQPLKERMWTTEKNDRHYWHVRIQKVDDRYELRLSAGGNNVDITNYRIHGNHATES